MRKLIMWNLVTLDGYFEGARNWDLEWHNEVWGDELEHLALDQLHTADMLVFGRVTYEGMAAHWTTATGAVADLMNGLPKLAFSRTLESVSWSNTTLAGEATASFISTLKRQGSGNLFVFGSANLSATLTNEGLFDEYRLLVVPVILGTGTPLFGRSMGRRRLKLLDSKPLASGGVILRYANG